MYSRFLHTKIVGIKTVVPEKEISIYDELEYYDNSEKKLERVRRMVGFYKRRVIDKLTTASDLAESAAQALIEEMKLQKETIDALLFVVQKPNTTDPSSAYLLHQKLGLSSRCIATDINQGCAGWVFGLQMASLMIENGTCKRVLLLNADTPTDDIEVSDRNRAPLFGDGGTATLLEYSEEVIKSSYNTETHSYGYEALISPFSGSVFRYDLTKEPDVDLMKMLGKERLLMPNGQEVNLLGHYMDGLAVFEFTNNIVPEVIKELLIKEDLAEKDISVLCLHQGNKQIVQTVGVAAGFPLDKVPYEAFENYGNNTMCSIPTALALLPKETDKSRICCCGFGNGLIVAAAILDFNDTYISEIGTYVQPKDKQTREEYIQYWKNKIQGIEQ